MDLIFKESAVHVVRYSARDRVAAYARSLKLLVFQRRSRPFSSDSKEQKRT